MKVAEHIRRNIQHQRGLVWFVFVMLLLFSAVQSLILLTAIGRWNVAIMADLGANSALILGILIPALAVAIVALRQITSKIIWVMLCVGGVIAASGPILVLLVGGDWATAVYFPGRNSPGTYLTLTGFAWIAWVPATVMFAGGIVGHALTSSTRKRT